MREMSGKGRKAWGRVLSQAFFKSTLFRLRILAQKLGERPQAPIHRCFGTLKQQRSDLKISWRTRRRSNKLKLRQSRLVL
jgi:hypothetical protein